MMSEIVPGTRHAELVPVIPTQRRLSRAVQAEVDMPLVEGLVANARVQAATAVAGQAMTGASMLSALEARLGASDPLTADRMAGFVEDYVLVARSALRRMGVVG
jgi:hypothetical protein